MLDREHVLRTKAVPAAGLEQLLSLNWERHLQYSNIPSTAVVNPNNSNRETKVSGTVIGTE